MRRSDNHSILSKGIYELARKGYWDYEMYFDGDSPLFILNSMWGLDIEWINDKNPQSGYILGDVTEMDLEKARETSNAALKFLMIDNNHQINKDPLPEYEPH